MGVLAACSRSLSCRVDIRNETTRFIVLFLKLAATLRYCDSGRWMVDDGRLTVDYGTYHCHIMFRFDTYVQIVLDTHSTEQQSYNPSRPVLCYLMVKDEKRRQILTFDTFTHHINRTY